MLCLYQRKRFGSTLGFFKRSNRSWLVLAGNSQGTGVSYNNSGTALDVQGPLSGPCQTPVEVRRCLQLSKTRKSTNEGRPFRYRYLPPIASAILSFHPR
jgi:hypothetical protein